MGLFGNYMTSNVCALLAPSEKVKDQRVRERERKTGNEIAMTYDSQR